MRGGGRGITGASDISQRIAALQYHSFGESLGVLVEMRVVVSELLIGVELIDSEPAGHTLEELRHTSIAYCHDRSSTRSGNIDRLVPGRPDQMEVLFPSRTKQARVRLIHRKFWQDVASSKGWPQDDLTVVDQFPSDD